MCGITGYIDAHRSTDRADLHAIATNMALRLEHRGPDDNGVFVEPARGLALGFRRLAIQDLSPCGAQPMTSHDGRYTIVFNGEIYNFHDLKAELEAGGGAPNWRGHSDTEVMLACIGRYGLDETLKRMDGMFAIALYDREANTLTLARDRMGEKPLYYGWMGRSLLFGSELKALAAHPDWEPSLNRNAAAAFVRYSYVPAPHSIIEGIFKLQPGHVLTLPLDRLEPGSGPAPQPYWAAAEVAENVAGFTGTPQDAVEELERLMTRSVQRRMISDVPLGAFLSGGIDSSAVVALMQKLGGGSSVNTYTIGFNDRRFDEAPHAKQVADRLGVNHTEYYVDTQATLPLVTRLPEIYDEPFADVSALPTLLLSEMTRRHVTTALAGDGGDELFCGYPRYHAALKKWKRSVKLPPVAGKCVEHLPFGLLNAVPGGGKPSRLGDKAYKKVSDFCASSLEGVYEGYMARWRMADRPAPTPWGTYFSDSGRWPDLSDGLNRLMFADSQSYLPDDLLVKVDRASMAHSLEVRAPLLDKDIIAFAWSLPSAFKHRDGQSKWPLRQVLYKHVPQSLIDRPKQGFEPPLADWLRGPLREWAQAHLLSDRLEDGGFLDPEPVRAVWEEHLKGQRNWHFELWNILMLQSWRAHWRV